MKKTITCAEYRKMQPNKKAKKEEALQIQIGKYLRMKYPDLIFTSDFAAGCKLSIGMAARNKAMQCGKKMPDMFIAHPNRDFSGLYLELKKDYDTIFTKDGKLRQNEHIIEQNKVHIELRQLGYMATFACGFDGAIKTITDYLSIPII